MSSLRSRSHYGWRFSNLSLSGAGDASDSAPPWPPRGGAGDPVGQWPACTSSVGDMKTQALRVTIHAYDDGAWMTALVRDTFERGALVQSDLVSTRWGDIERVWEQVAEGVQDVVELECQRLGIDVPPYPAVGRVAPF
jgi:hypothetical protein